MAFDYEESEHLPTNQPANRQADVIPDDAHAYTFLAQTWIGPLPDPVTMERYERLAPGAAERFLGFMESEIGHRQLMDHRESRRQDWGLVAAFFVVVLIVAVGAALIYLGYEWAGASVIGVNIVGLAAVFISGGFRRRQGQDDSETSGGATRE